MMCVKGPLYLTAPCSEIEMKCKCNAHLESTVTKHCNDTQEYHCCENSSGYDNSSSCHPTRSPSNPESKTERVNCLTETSFPYVKTD